MARPCSICGHPDRAAIDARLMAGGSLNAVATEFGLSRPALQRHRAAHMGNTVTITIPAASSTAPAPISVGVDGVDALFARALAAPEYSLQDHVRLIFYELRRQLASSQGREDRAHALRVSREMRAMLDFVTFAPIDNLRQAPGWAEVPTPPDPVKDMWTILTAGGVSSPLVCTAVERLNRLHDDGFGTALRSSLFEDAGSANPSGAALQ